MKALDEEGKRKAIKSLLAEFSSTFDRREATTCVQELGDGAYWLHHPSCMFTGHVCAQT